jgi:arylsulfatase A-like enzyme
MVGWMVACGSPQAPAPAAGTAPTAVAAPAASQPDLVLLVEAGLRADPPRGGGAEAAFFKALGPPTARWTAAYAQSPSAFVSLGSLLTGRYASNLPMCGLYTAGLSGVDGGLARPDAASDRAWCAQIPDTVRTLPEVLGLYGYHTALATSGLVGAPLLAHGFGDTFATDTSGDDAGWKQLQDWTGTWWKANAAAPRLLVVVATDLQVGERAELVEKMGFRSAGVLGAAPPATEGKQVAHAYAEAARAAGVHAKALLDGVASGTGRPRATFVTSTNGWSLDETTGFTDRTLPLVTTSFALDRTVHVPLAVYGTGVPAGTSDAVVQLLDLFPTMGRLAGVPLPAGLPGHDLATPAGPAYAEFGDTLLLRDAGSVLQFRGFLHLSTVLDPQVDERLEDAANWGKYYTLYDIAADPVQTHDLASGRPQELRELRDEMLRIRKGPAAPPEDTWSDPRRLWEIRMARSQGYW